jgi:hypothetical protein
MELFSYILSQSVHCWCIEKLLFFCKLILYSTTLLKLFILSRSFSVEFLGFLRYKIMSSGNRDGLSICLPICLSFISSSCPISLVKKSRTMWHRAICLNFI